MINVFDPGTGLFWRGTTVPETVRERNRWHEVRQFRAANGSTPFDIVLRFVLILASTRAVFLTTANASFLFWALAYIASVALTQAFLARITPPVTRLDYGVLVALQMVTNAVFVAIPIQIWITDTPIATKVMGACAVVAMIMFNLTRRNIPSWAVYPDAISVLVTIAVIAVQTLLAMDKAAHQGLVALCALCVATYYVHAHFASVNQTRSFNRARREAVEREKTRAVKQVTSGIAHDFNNILTAVQGNIELAQLSTDNAERMALLDAARNATNQAGQIVEDMLASTGRARLRLAPVLVYEHFDLLRPVLEATTPHTIELTLRNNAAGATVMADKSVLDRAMIQLLNNAIDALEERDGKIEVSCNYTDAREWPGSNLEPDQHYVAFCVSDSGPGIPLSDLQQVTDPFFTTKPKRLGSGLSLAMIKGFATQAGGALVLENLPDAGLRAALILPLAPR